MINVRELTSASVQVSRNSAVGCSGGLTSPRPSCYSNPRIMV